MAGSRKPISIHLKRSEVLQSCFEYCGICCGKCNCVPSGTYGNKDECLATGISRTAKESPYPHPIPANSTN
ncbi:hypothetical protein L6164_024605 [Bauhinia variegata]|uniref:Uncharacterized protein n=1 Tax=Bauhinia variegata TaxID=167791 RepID=A0ACB9LY62_BAUVA|nr:hypothetical protein L6164_024605 [Bauhinia variegata]